jgi:hypothetical protein
MSKAPDKISTALKQKLAAGEANKLADQLLSLANNSEYPNAQIGALREIVDRTEGKAIQPMVVASYEMDENTVNRLMAIAEMFQLQGK